MGSSDSNLVDIFYPSALDEDGMKYRFVINGIGIVPKTEFQNLWQAFMWVYGVFGDKEIGKVKIEEVSK